MIIPYAEKNNVIRVFLGRVYREIAEFSRESNGAFPGGS